MQMGSRKRERNGVKQKERKPQIRTKNQKQLSAKLALALTALRFDLSTCFTCDTKIAGIVSPAGDQEVMWCWLGGAL